MRGRQAAIRILSTALLLALPGASPPALAGTLQVSLGNATLCRANSGSGFGSLGNCSGFNGALGFGHGHYGNAHTAGVTGNGTAAVTATIDAGVFTDTADHPARETLEQALWYDLTVTVDVLPGQSWEITFDQEARGLFAVISEAPAGSFAGTTSQAVLFDVNHDVSVLLASGDYDIDLDFTGFGGGATGSREFFGSRSDVLSGSGDAVLTGSVRTGLRAFSSCLNTAGNPPCTNGPESAVLYGSDAFGGASPASVDDYATWARAVGPDGYTASFSLITLPEPATAWLLAGGLTALAAWRRRPAG